MERLSRRRNVAIWKGLICIPSFLRGTAISHLFFADDALLLCSADRKSVRNLQKIIQSFERSSGMIIKKTKKKIVPLLVEGDRVSLIQSKLGWGVLPILYLGLPLFTKRLTHHMCQDIILKVRKRRKGGDFIDDSNRPYQWGTHPFAFR
jgi:hypothetical protein